MSNDEIIRALERSIKNLIDLNFRMDNKLITRDEFETATINEIADLGDRLVLSVLPLYGDKQSEVQDELES